MMKNILLTLLVLLPALSHAAQFEALSEVVFKKTDESYPLLVKREDGCILDGKVLLYKNQEAVFFDGKSCGMNPGDSIIFQVEAKTYSDAQIEATKKLAQEYTSHPLIGSELKTAMQDLAKQVSTGRGPFILKKLAIGKTLYSAKPSLTSP